MRRRFFNALSFCILIGSAAVCMCDGDGDGHVLSELTLV